MQNIMQWLPDGNENVGRDSSVFYSLLDSQRVLAIYKYLYIR